MNENNQPKQTPGPYVVNLPGEKKYYESSEIEVFSPVENIVICRMIEGGDIAKKNNAKLIAAAPDLLEALIQVKKTIDVFGNKNANKSSEMLYNIIDSAIKKATE